MNQTKRSSALDKLDTAFLEQQKESRKKPKDGNTRKKLILYAGIVLVLVSIFIFAVVALSSDEEPVNKDEKVAMDPPEAPPFLNDEQKTDWEKKAVDDEQVFMQFSETLVMKAGSNKLNLQLVNPPYSAYSIKVQLVLKDNESDILYDSELIKPGNYLENVELTKSLEVGAHPVIVKYSFFNEDGTTLLGNYQKETSIEVQ